MKIHKIIIVIALAITNLALATDAAGNAADYLQIPVGATAAGMGGAFTSIANDATASYWNPAGLLQIKSNEFTTMNANMNLDRDFKYIGFAKKISDKLSLGLGWTRFSVDSIPETDANGNVLGYFDDTEDSFYTSLAYKLTDKLTAGCSLKVLKQDLYTMDADTVGFDLGLMYEYSNKLKFGAVIKNIGASLEWNDGVKEDLPLHLQLGASLKLKKDMIFALDVKKVEEEDPQILLGLEKKIADKFSLRIGRNEKGATAGASIIFNFMKLDYSYSEDELGNLHRISASYKW